VVPFGTEEQASVFRFLPATRPVGKVAGRKKVPRRSFRSGGGIFDSIAPGPRRLCGHVPIGGGFRRGKDTSLERR
jgi:hypothetical protein